MRASFVHRLVLVAACALNVACGGAQLDRLVGEPAAADKYTLPVTRRTHPSIDGLQRFLAAMQLGDVDTAWQQLSAETRKALQARATPVGVRGVDLLRMRKLPLGDTMASAVPFDPVAMFALPDVETLQLQATPAKEDIVEQQVKITNKSKTVRTVVMRFEGYRWRVHLPELRMPVNPVSP